MCIRDRYQRRVHGDHKKSFLKAFQVQTSKHVLLHLLKHDASFRNDEHGNNDANVQHGNDHGHANDDAIKYANHELHHSNGNGNSNGSNDHDLSINDDDETRLHGHQHDDVRIIPPNKPTRKRNGISQA
eukprot:TRINITY_DN1344_c0_g1_i2.p1 TRINITY_DN1344_c0_g1~~TRINITY_DN1344_c0_g1_i2.p1  ORF type:complete len:129 (+),score=19.29 TRINITY_DN1344_c0_g1_i2:67-453(+)